MNALILAGGFGTRLYPLTLNQPKSLLKINKKPILEHLIDKIQEIKEIDTIYILSNSRFYINFLEWFNDFKKNDHKPIKIFNNGITNDRYKNGAIKDLKDSIDLIGKEDLLLLASDNIFNFDLRELIELSKIKDSSTVALKIIKDTELIKKYSCVLIDKNNKLTYFEEKPENPVSNLTCTACYFIKKEDLEKIKNNDFKNQDNMGEIINFLNKESIVHGKIFREFWADIGSIEELQRIRL